MQGSKPNHHSSHRLAVYEEGYLALYACIMNEELYPERVLHRMGCLDRHKHKSQVASDEEIAQMIQMRETMTYKEIGQAFGISASGVFHRLSRYEHRRKKKGDAPVPRMAGKDREVCKECKAVTV